MRASSMRDITEVYRNLMRLAIFSMEVHFGRRNQQLTNENTRQRQELADQNTVIIEFSIAMI